MSLLLLRVILWLLCAALCACAVPNVTISQGLVVGASLRSLRGREIFAYRGIPYAKSPTGVLRFKPPEPVDAGEEVIDATEDGPPCVQKMYFLPTVVVGGVEDCLTINVYVPDVPQVPPLPSPLPVIVFVHGGAWLSGGGASYLAGPYHLLDKDVVLVTFNYRVGALGFLSTGDAAARGNYGMKDQVAALRWVRDNVAAFGGDPSSVTLFGQSAGAASAHMHMFSDMSDGLFHRAISGSATALSTWTWPAQDPLRQAQTQGAVFGCAQQDTAALVDCLRTVDAVQLADSADIFHFWDVEPLAPYPPVVEAPWDGLGEQPFLTGEPLELLRLGRFQRKPWLMGVLEQEGIIRALPILSNATLLGDLNANWNTLGPAIFQLDRSVAEPAVIDELWRNITTFYFDDQLPVTPKNGIHLVDLFSDRLVIQGAQKAARMQARRGHDSIYMYNFRYKGLYSYSSVYVTEPVADYGIAHGDEQIYLLPVVGFPAWPEHHRDLKLLDSLVTLWTNFATFSHPTPDGTAEGAFCDADATTTDDRCDTLASLAWTPVLSTELVVLDIWHNVDTAQIEFRMSTELYSRRMEFWDQAPLAENAQP